jgi:hypothetical protein
MGTKGKRFGTLESRFWAKVEKTDGCWWWRGAHDQRGYGQIWDEGRRRKATHVALQMAGRPLLPGQMACHHCDNPPCVRPDHLFAGSMSDNLRDCVRKGRQVPARLQGNSNPSRLYPERLSRGEAHGQSKLTVAGVIEIRRLRGVERQVDLAKRFAVCRSTIQKVQSGEYWGHIPRIAAELERMAGEVKP